MTVTFKSEVISPSTARAELTPLLLPQLRSRHGSPDARSTLLRVLVRGLGSEVTPFAIRGWCRVNGDPEVLALVESNPAWSSLVAIAREHLADRAPSLSAARRLVGRLVTEIPVGVVSPRTEASARIALAVMVVQMITRNESKILCTSAWLGAQLNLQPLAAGRLLRVMEFKLKWIRRVGGRSGGLFFRLTKLDQETGSWADLHEAMIAALVEKDYRQNPLALAISTASHPAWHYGLGYLDSGRAWLTLVRSMSGQPKSVGLGLGPVTVRKLTRELHAQLPGALEGGIDLELSLDVIADLSLATFYKKEREMQLAAEATDNRARVVAFREAQTRKFELRKAAGVLLRAALGEVREIPPGTDLTSAAAFVGEMATWFNRDSPIEDPTMFAPVAEMLTERMVSAEWSAALIQRAIPHVIRTSA